MMIRAWIETYCSVNCAPTASETPSDRDDSLNGDVKLRNTRIEIPVSLWNGFVEACRASGRNPYARISHRVHEVAKGLDLRMRQGNHPDSLHQSFASSEERFGVKLRVPAETLDAAVLNAKQSGSTLAKIIRLGIAGDLNEFKVSGVLFKDEARRPALPKLLTADALGVDHGPDLDGVFAAPAPMTLKREFDLCCQAQLLHPSSVLRSWLLDFKEKRDHLLPIRPCDIRPTKSLKGPSWDTQIRTRINKSDLAEVRTRAASLGVSMSHLARIWVNTYLVANQQTREG